MLMLSGFCIVCDENIGIGQLDVECVLLNSIGLYQSVFIIVL